MVYGLAGGAGDAGAAFGVNSKSKTWQAYAHLNGHCYVNEQHICMAAAQMTVLCAPIQPITRFITELYTKYRAIYVSLFYTKHVK